MDAYKKIVNNFFYRKMINANYLLNPLFKKIERFRLPKRYFLKFFDYYMKKGNLLLICLPFTYKYKNKYYQDYIAAIYKNKNILEVHYIDFKQKPIRNIKRGIYEFLEKEFTNTNFKLVIYSFFKKDKNEKKKNSTS